MAQRTGGSATWPKISEWQSDSDSDLETARIWQLQLTFFHCQPRELCEQLRLPWPAACKLYDDGFFSFDPRPNNGLNEAQEAEFLLVGSVAAAGYDSARLARILHGLKWPYQYRQGRIYLEWVTRSWRLLPVIKDPDPESIFDDWIATLKVSKTSARWRNSSRLLPQPSNPLASKRQNLKRRDLPESYRIGHLQLQWF